MKAATLDFFIPPAEWKTVVGGMLPVAGQKVVESAVSGATSEVKQKVIK